MNPSPEYLALKGLAAPRPESQPGDMWLCRRLGIVKIFNAHKRGQHRRRRINAFHLYHFGKPSMIGRPCDWRDNDYNAVTTDPAVCSEQGEKWEYIGNIFELLPYAALAGKPYVR